MKGISIKRRVKDAIKNLIRETAELNFSKLEVGIIDGDEMHVGSKISVKAVAAINTYGTKGSRTGGPIPPRPFIEPSMLKNKQKYVDMLAKDTPRVILRLKSKNKMFDAVGKVAVLDIKHFIKDGNFEPLSERQVRKKGHSAPLFHTFQMMDAIDYRVKGK